MDKATASGAVHAGSIPAGRVLKKMVMRKQKITISVIGGSSISPKVADLAKAVGKMVAQLGCVLVCGGLGGAMEAVAKGAQSAGGLTIGLLPGKNKADANPYIDIALPTSIGYARNAMVACSADIIVALPGSFGTPAGSSVTRPDLLQPSLDRALVLSQAPDTDQAFFKVPKVIER